MTTTRQATWREAKKGQLVQAKDLTVWSLVSMGRDADGQLVVTMQETVGRGPLDAVREIQVRPPSYDSPVTFVEPLIDHDAQRAQPTNRQPGIGGTNLGQLRSPSAAAAELSEKIRVAQERAHAAVARANAERQAQGGIGCFPPVDEALRAEIKAQDPPMPYVEPMPDLTAYDVRSDLRLQALAAGDSPDPEMVETAEKLVPRVDPSEAAPIQSADEVWPVGPLDDASAGEMMTHLFLFHGDWQKENGKKGKSLLADLHRIHGEKEHGTGQSAGIHHEHRQKGNDAP